jgi:hypothetical protein
MANHGAMLNYEAMPKDLSDEFKRHARFLIDTFSRELGVTLRYDEQSVEYLDGYIARNRAGIRKKTEGQYSGVVNTIGSFLGECIIANYGGQWKQSETGVWGVYFDDKNAVFPFVKVEKALGPEGEFDSIASFYSLSKLVRDGKLGQDSGS